MLNDAEQHNSEWWCNYHKESAAWLTTRINQLLNGSDEQIEGILRGSLPAFIETYIEDYEKLKEENKCNTQ